MPINHDWPSAVIAERHDTQAYANVQVNDKHGHLLMSLYHGQIEHALNLIDVLLPVAKLATRDFETSADLANELQGVLTDLATLIIGDWRIDFELRVLAIHEGMKK